MKRRVFGILVLGMFAVIALPGADKPAALLPAKRIGIEEFEKLRGQSNTVVLDVRSKAEFEKGRIPGATNIDISSLRFSETVAALDKSKTYLVNCAVGMRSARACRQMQALGFTNLYDFAPGFDGWKKAGKPVEK